MNNRSRWGIPIRARDEQHRHDPRNATSATAALGPRDAALDAALRDMAAAPLPAGFVARTVERATGLPRFRVRAIDVALPVLAGSTTGIAFAWAIWALAGDGPIWLRRLALFGMEAWTTFLPGAMPSPFAVWLAAVMFAMFAAALLALVLPTDGRGRGAV